VLEPFGFVPLESMACGTPVLGVAEGGVRESILHGKTGWLVQRNQQEFAQAIVQLLSQPRLIEELGREGPAYVQENWNWDKSVNNLEQHLETVARQI
jgi:glycosyltransferase involved in cell wall biosynthesis